jgi:hypothetical protein
MFGGYSYSIRTTGEVVGFSLFEKEVLCILVLFIAANVILFLNCNTFFIVYNKFL